MDSKAKESRPESDDTTVSITWLNGIIDATEESISKKECAQEELRPTLETVARFKVGISPSRKSGGFVNSRARCIESLAAHKEQLSTLNLAHGFAQFFHNVEFPDSQEAQVNVCIQIGLFVIRFIHDPCTTPIFSTDGTGLQSDADLENHTTRETIEKACAIYRIFYKCIRSKVCQNYRQHLKRLDFPSFPSYQGIMDHLRTVDRITQNLPEPQISMLTCGEHLMKLEILDSLVIRNSLADEVNERKDQRIQVIDELCRVIYSRIEYHFIVGVNSNTAGNINYLPELLFNYLQETLNLRRICEFIQLWIPPLATRTMEELVVELGRDPSSSLSLPHRKATSYFLERVASMIKHVLLKRDYFHEILNHSDDSNLNISRDDVLRSALENIISFDNFMVSLSGPNDEKYIPRLLNDVIIYSRQAFDWWIHYEFLFCSSKIQHSFSHLEAVSDRRSSSCLGPILPPEVEVFVSILKSLFVKADMILSDILQREFSARILVPVSVQYIEFLHDKASSLRSSLLKRHSVKMTLPSQLFIDTIRQWTDTIASAHAASLCLQFHLRDCEMRSCFHDIQKVTESFQKLRDGLIFDVSNCITENILLERTKLASYFIRCAHLLSSSSVEGFVSISSDLNEAVHFLTVLMDTCYYECRFHIDSLSESKEIAEFLQFSGKSIILSVASSLETKFIQAILDVHDSVSEIYVAGALIFKDNIDTILSIFPRESIHSFYRIENLMKLLAMDSQKYANLRSAAVQLLSGLDQTFDSSGDSLIIEQVQAMLHAQGVDVPFDDALRILTKRLK